MYQYDQLKLGEYYFDVVMRQTWRRLNYWCTMYFVYWLNDYVNQTVSV